VDEVIGQVVSVNVGETRAVEWHGRTVTTAIWKTPVAGPVAVRGVNLAGDDQADRRVHGGDDKAVYAYAAEDYTWWNTQVDGRIDAATFGENLTTEGADLDAAGIGERWRIGSATLEISQPRLPCFKLGVRMGDAEFVDRFEHAGRYGAYLRIVEEGALQAGDEIVRVRPALHDLCLADLGRAHREPTPELLERIIANRDVPATWRSSAARTLARLTRAGRSLEGAAPAHEEVPADEGPEEDDEDATGAGAGQDEQDV
jgi:MOSC domain-containing protein YiiM